MRFVVVFSLMLSWIVMMQMSSPVSAQQSATAPMDVARLATLKAAATSGDNGWAKVAYREYINGLIDGLIDKEGEKFCLPATMRAARAESLYKELSADIEDAAKRATPKDLVAVAARQFLAQKYPCKR